MFHFDDEYKTIQELKSEEIWPLDYITTKGVVPYIRRLNRDINILEFGTAQGYTTIHLLESCPNIKTITTIDLYGQDSHNLRLKETADKNFKNQSKIKTEIEKEPIDVLIIQTGSSVSKILNEFGPLVSSEGIIAVANAKEDFIRNDIINFRKSVKHTTDIHNVNNGVQFWFVPKKIIKEDIFEVKSQLGQDLWVYEACNQKKDGFFVKFGATDGITGSNTYTLEKLGWKGILAEPNPSWHHALANNRPNTITTHDAVYSESGKKVNFVIPFADDLATIEEYRFSDEHSQKRQNVKTIQVSTISLNDLLEKYKAPRTIDYISIDTEGSELDILKAFDFEKYDVKCFTIEHNFIEPRRTEIRDLLISHGYVRLKENESKWDDFYVKV